jgi:endonuclease G
MAPASNHKQSQQTMDETFVLSNTSPQVGVGFNQGYWARCERFVQELVSQFSDVWVVTGPLYLPRPITDGSAKSGAKNGPAWRMDHLFLGT